jgi:hypothetical protein
MEEMGRRGTANGAEKKKAMRKEENLLFPPF